MIVIDTRTALYIKIGTMEFTKTVNYPGVPAVGHIVVNKIGWPDLDASEFKITEVSYVVGAQHLEAQLSTVNMAGPGMDRTMRRVAELMKNADWEQIK